LFSQFFSIFVLNVVVLERLFFAAHVGIWGDRSTTRGSAAFALTGLAFDLSGGPAQAGSEFIGHHFDGSALVTLAGGVFALLKATRDDDA
jgi:hypothetical protein